MFDRTEKWCTHTGFGTYPDADMLPVGAILQDYGPDNRTKFTENEQFTMLTLWCIFRSPLMIGGELTKLDNFTTKLLTNEGILKMHRNARHSHQVWRKEINGCEHILWAASGAEGGFYAAIFNAGESDGEIEISLTDLEIYDAVKGEELWSGEKVNFEEKIKVSLEKHGAKVFYFE